MKKGIIGKKLGMTQVFDQNGNVVPVTVIEAGPCLVTFKKTAENDGYDAVQLGYGEIKANKVTKPLKGHFDKNDVAPKRVLKEFRLEDTSALNIGDLVKADVFAEGEAVDVVGRSKGKGYAGVIKRHGFHRLKMSHGTGPVARHGGSLGAVRVTVQNLAVVKVDAEKNILAVKGAIPGPKGGFVFVSDSVKTK
jgi:large subunit ribosomal protein L3